MSVFNDPKRPPIYAVKRHFLGSIDGQKNDLLVMLSIFDLFSFSIAVVVHEYTWYHRVLGLDVS